MCCATFASAAFFAILRGQALLAPHNPARTDDPNLLQNRSILSRAAVISAGVIANVIFAYLTLLVQGSRGCKGGMEGLHVFFHCELEECWVG
eukprot:scaffold113480_cov17-Tisochrysis_lutea.AAC.1